jgi:hypothetical protein
MHESIRNHLGERTVLDGAVVQAAAALRRGLGLREACKRRRRGDDARIRGEWLEFSEKFPSDIWGEWRNIRLTTPLP